MKSIVQVVQHLSPGGIEVMALEIVRLKRQGVQVWVVSLEGTELPSTALWPRLANFSDRLIFLNKEPGWRPSVVMQLARILQTVGADAVHTHHIGPMIYGGAAARLAGIAQWIHTEHDAWHLQNFKRRCLEKSVCTLLKPVLVADSHFVAASVQDYLGVTDVEVVLNGVDTEKFIPGNLSEARKTLGLPEDIKLIGCAGRMEQEKGQHILLRALASLPAGVHLALAGNGSQEAKLREQVQILQLSDRVHFLGLVENMVAFYQALDVFCLSSFKEGMPLSPLEAQACGVPAVLTDTGACIETLCPNTGELVPAGEPVALAAALYRVLGRVAKDSPRSFICEQANARTMTEAYTQLCLNKKA